MKKYRAKSLPRWTSYKTTSINFLIRKLCRVKAIPQTTQANLEATPSRSRTSSQRTTSSVDNSYKQNWCFRARMSTTPICRTKIKLPFWRRSPWASTRFPNYLRTAIKVLHICKPILSREINPTLSWRAHHTYRPTKEQRTQSEC